MATFFNPIKKELVVDFYYSKVARFMDDAGDTSDAEQVIQHIYRFVNNCVVLSVSDESFPKCSDDGQSIPHTSTDQSNEQKTS